MRAGVCFLPLMVAIGSAGLRAQTPTLVSGGSGSAVAVTTAGSASGVTAAPISPAPTVVVPTPVPRLDPPGNLRLTNLSTRARVTADAPLITGFVIRGTTPRTVLVRAAGPALDAFGVTDAARAPRLRLRDAAGATMAENAGWNNAPLAAAATATAGAFPFADGSADSAAVATLAPGSYTAEVSVDSDGGGVALVEVYDVEGTADGSRLANASTLSTVAPAGGEVVGGFVVAGAGSRQYLIRGVGPGLAPFGVAGLLRDPTLTVYDSTGRQLTGNDDWAGNGKPGLAVSAAAPVSPTGYVTPFIDSALVNLAGQATGAFPLADRSTDAALVISLPAGAYTVQVRGVGTSVVTFSPTATTGTTATGAGGAQSVAAIAAVAVGVTGGSLTASIIPAAPGVALLELYEVP